MTPEGRQDLAAVIAEMRLDHRSKVHRWAVRLALLLDEAQRPQVQENKEHHPNCEVAFATCTCDKEQKNEARVETMGDSKDNPTASMNETTPATVTPNQVINEAGDVPETTTDNPQSWIAWKRRALAAEAQLSAQAWRDIASAPADGRRVLLWWPWIRIMYPVVGWWQVNGGWQSEELLEGENEPPTHWMPLPAAPENTMNETPLAAIPETSAQQEEP